MLTFHDYLENRSIVADSEEKWHFASSGYGLNDNFPANENA